MSVENSSTSSLTLPPINNTYQIKKDETELFKKEEINDNNNIYINNNESDIQSTTSSKKKKKKKKDKEKKKKEKKMKKEDDNETEIDTENEKDNDEKKKKKEKKEKKKKEKERKRKEQEAEETEEQDTKQTTDIDEREEIESQAYSTYNTDTNDDDDNSSYYTNASSISTNSKKKKNKKSKKNKKLKKKKKLLLKYQDFQINFENYIPYHYYSWIKFYDNTQHCYYYYNTQSQETTWLAPCFLCAKESERYCLNCSNSFCSKDFHNYHRILDDSDRLLIENINYCQIIEKKTKIEQENNKTINSDNNNDNNNDDNNKKLPESLQNLSYLEHKWSPREFPLIKSERPNDSNLTNILCEFCHNLPSKKFCLNCLDYFCTRCFTLCHMTTTLKIHETISPNQVDYIIEKEIKYEEINEETLKLDDQYQKDQDELNKNENNNNDKFELKLTKDIDNNNIKKENDKKILINEELTKRIEIQTITYTHKKTKKTSYIKPYKLMTKNEKVLFQNFINYKKTTEEFYKKIEELQIENEKIKYERDLLYMESGGNGNTSNYGTRHPALDTIKSLDNGSTEASAMNMMANAVNKQKNEAVYRKKIMNSEDRLRGQNYVQGLETILNESKS